MKNPQLAQLKVKAKTLAAESKIIRKDEIKWKNYHKPKSNNELQIKIYNIQTSMFNIRDSEAANSNESNELIATLRNEIKALKAKNKIQHKSNVDWPNETRESLYRHRVDVLRPEARAVNIAMGFLRGLKYEQIEQRFKTQDATVWMRIVDIIYKYNTENSSKDSIRAALAIWLTEHPAHDNHPLSDMVAMFTPKVVAVKTQ